MNQMLTRRRLLTGTTALGTVALLAACAQSTTTPPANATLTNVLGLLAAGAAAFATALPTVPGLSVDALATAQAVLAKVNTDAAAIAATLATPTPATVAEWVQEIESVVNTALPFIPVAAPYAPIVAALESLIPLALADLGITGEGKPAGVSNVPPAPVATALATLRALPQVVR